jgi:two-component system, LytTR family, sensor kinase
MKKWLYPGLHVLGWMLMAINRIQDFMGSYKGRPVDIAWIKASGWPPLAGVIVQTLAYQAISMVAFYTAYAWTAPALFPRRRYGPALLSLLGVFAAMVTTRYVMEFWVIRPLLHFENYFGRPIDPWWYITNCIGYSFNYCLFGVILYFLIHSGKIQQEKAEAELAFLRSQINPHFLFNTINDIYSLVYRQHKDAPEALLKLSGILRYALYEENRNNVSLEKELTYLQDYLDLVAIGSNHHTYIDFQVDGSPIAKSIAPLLLIPFAENMVRHGVIDDPTNSASLLIRIRDNSFHLLAVNHIRHHNKDAVGGIGLPNVRRRLELLYPGQHSFEVMQQEGRFRCVLTLTLNSAQ